MKKMRPSTLPTLLVTALLFGACGSSEDPAPAPAEPTTQGEIPVEALDQARAAASALGSELMKTLMRELAEGGPAQAVRVCAEVAPSIAATHSHDGIQVRRVSLKLRNPANAPDAYEARKLNELALLGEQGDMPEEIVAVVNEDGRPRLRYLRPISVMSPCLKCHGDRVKMDPEAADLIRQRYPDDQATGYSVGDLRGAISVSVDL
jgi:hypothetical protein